MKRTRISLVIGILAGSILDTYAVNKNELMAALETYRNEDIAPQVISTLAQRTNISEDTARTLLRAFKKDKLTEQIVEGALAESNRGSQPPPAPPFPSHLFNQPSADPLAAAKEAAKARRAKDGGAHIPPAAANTRAPSADFQAELEEKLKRRNERTHGSHSSSSSEDRRRSPSPHHAGQRNTVAEIAQVQREMRAEEKRIQDAERKLAELRKKWADLKKQQEKEESSDA